MFHELPCTILRLLVIFSGITPSNMIIDKRLAGLKYLEFGRRFNHPVYYHSLPPNPTTLVFGAEFAQPLVLGGVSVLPPTLKELIVYYSYPDIAYLTGPYRLTVMECD